jgi:hypothetical protein
MWVELLVALVGRAAFEAFIVATTIVSSSADGKSDSGSRSEIAAAAVVEVFANAQGGDIKPAFRLGEGSCKSTTCGDLFSMQLATPEKGVLLIESLIVRAISSRSLS